MMTQAQASADMQEIGARLNDAMIKASEMLANMEAPPDGLYAMLMEKLDFDRWTESQRQKAMCYLIVECAAGYAMDIVKERCNADLSRTVPTNFGSGVEK